MADGTCIEPGCNQRVNSRGLCSSHYYRHARAGTLERVALPATNIRHRLANRDVEAMTADCSICGPGVEIRWRQHRNGRYLECAGGSLTTMRRYQMKYRFGIDEAAYRVLLEAQGGTCAICNEPPGRERLLVDHDHDCCSGGRACGKCIRGLLCRKCNSAIGFLRDSPDLALRASMYLLQK